MVSVNDHPHLASSNHHSRLDRNRGKDPADKYDDAGQSANHNCFDLNSQHTVASQSYLSPIFFQRSSVSYIVLSDFWLGAQAAL
jgi:hypothetical protein